VCVGGRVCVCVWGGGTELSAGDVVVVGKMLDTDLPCQSIPHCCHVVEEESRLSILPDNAAVLGEGEGAMSPARPFANMDTYFSNVEGSRSSAS
jgi:hypothetical protein